VILSGVEPGETPDGRRWGTGGGEGGGGGYPAESFLQDAAVNASSHSP